MIRSFSSRTSPSPHGREAGLTLIELIVTVAILGLLASAAVPVARWNIKREKERELHADLWQMRKAIDTYKDIADKGGIQTKVDSDGLSPGFGYAGKRRRREGQEDALPTPHSDRSHDQQTRLGSALGAG